MTDSTGMRLSALAIVALSLVGALTARLWVLTAVEGETAVEAAEANRIRTIQVPAPRGRIFDRNRLVLVDNAQVRQLRVDTRELDEAIDYDEDARDALYASLAEELNRAAVFTPDDPCPTCESPSAEWDRDLVATTLEDNFIGAFIPTPLASDVPEELEIALAERHEQFPGVDVERVAVRTYPHGVLGAHVLGYVGSITEEELARDDVAGSSKPYAPNDEIGKTGVEAAYEAWLRGTPGTRVIEVDAEGDIVREISYDPPEPGYDVMLELDLRVQAMLERELAASAEANNAPGASAVVLDPRNGAVRAMASYPTYNPQDFIDGLSTEEYAALTAEDSGFPLSNKAISGVYAPGSTFKPVTALAGLRAGIVTPATTVNDTGVYYVQGCEEESCRFQNAGAVPNGTVNLQSSLTLSSDYYYYRIGDFLWGDREELGEDFLQQTAREWGFDADTGIDLPQEQDGFAYTPAELRELHEQYPEAFPYGDQWRTGNTVNMSIGQGDLGVTPVQLANMYAALVNGGTLYRPHVAQSTLQPRPAEGDWTTDTDTSCRVDNSAELTADGELCSLLPSPGGIVEIPAEWRDPMVSGLIGVAGPNGTSAEAFDGFDLGGFPIAGKTGTAQVAGKGDFALYVGVGPVRPGAVPEYVISVVVEDVGAFGGEVAAPVARAVFDGLRDPALLPMIEATPASPILGSTAGGADAATDTTIPAGATS